eukprot:CAMPEP_0172529362 /NCGR_PEP_ID=MMETSP1067-20121228/3460_1 /TAXON_ID=265564 ORGANISM="Thalassiosira punctigera, Strain Tpunct2005C2" /NCGR_SAMPLE_ID=MMETSP1067 /ASSEMBLY_ACC=CAM_ASM_000444 /LENGTH=232 /DNA_ID=CAMNT_0013313401 /DNA_START=20 /DNA_END=714 /DNA_ORIENTATION=+
MIAGRTALLLAAAAALTLAGAARAFAPAAFPAAGPPSAAGRRQRNPPSSTAAAAREDGPDDDDALPPLFLGDRRRLLGRWSAAAAVALGPLPALADASADDADRMLKGYARLSYLLDHWDELTETCDGTKKDPFTGKATCVKSPLVVSEYMGFKSTSDPLFRAEKAMRRLEARVPSSKEADYLDLVEAWVQTSEEAQGMAYTSSWAGPENPNGGDDKIAEFLERSKKQVTDA